MFFTGRIENWITKTVSGVVDSINEWMVENDMEIALAVVDGCMESVNLQKFMEGEDPQYAGLLKQPPQLMNNIILLMEVAVISFNFDYSISTERRNVSLY